MANREFIERSADGVHGSARLSSAQLSFTSSPIQTSNSASKLTGCISYATWPHVHLNAYVKRSTLQHSNGLQARAHQTIASSHLASARSTWTRNVQVKLSVQLASDKLVAVGPTKRHWREYLHTLLKHNSARSFVGLSSSLPGTGSAFVFTQTCLVHINQIIFVHLCCKSRQAIVWPVKSCVS